MEYVTKQDISLTVVCPRITCEGERVGCHGGRWGQKAGLLLPTQHHNWHYCISLALARAATFLVAPHTGEQVNPFSQKDKTNLLDSEGWGAIVAPSILGESGHCRGHWQCLRALLIRNDQIPKLGNASTGAEYAVDFVGLQSNSLSGRTAVMT